MDHSDQRLKGGFQIAAFGVDGALVGMDIWPAERLSQKWIATCAEHLDRHGTSFDEPWSGKLSHIRTKLTAAAGAALVTFRANDRILASIALASGESPAEERLMLEMFVKSLWEAQLIRAATKSRDDAFQQLLHIAERPLMVVVPWPDDAISDQDHALVRELSIHLAAAFFLGQS